METYPPLPSEGKGHTFESCRVRQNYVPQGGASVVVSEPEWLKLI